MIVRLAIRLVVLAVFSWPAELLLPVVRQGKHAHPAQAAHDHS
jgi:hypothetical protein